MNKDFNFNLIQDSDIITGPNDIQDNKTERKNQQQKIDTVYNNSITNISTKVHSHIPDLLEQHNNDISIKYLIAINRNNSIIVNDNIPINDIEDNNEPNEIDNNESNEDIISESESESKSIIEKREKEINYLTKRFDIIEDIKNFYILDVSKLFLNNDSFQVKKIFKKKLRIIRKKKFSLKRKKK